MGLGPWSLIALLGALAGTFDRMEPASSPVEPAPVAPAADAAPPFELTWEPTPPSGARAFAASFDTSDILRVGSLKVQERCIRAAMDEDDAIANITSRPAARPFRRALDDADLDAPPDPPRYLRLTLD